MKQLVFKSRGQFSQRENCRLAPRPLRLVKQGGRVGLAPPTAVGDHARSASETLLKTSCFMVQAIDKP